MAGITLTPPDVQLVAREATGVRAGGPTIAGALARATALVERAPIALPAPGGWSWRGTALLVVLVLHPYLLVLALQDPAVDRARVAGAMSVLLVQIGVLGSAVILKYDWHLSRRTTIGWLAMMLAFAAGQQVPFALVAVEGSPQADFGAVIGVTQLPGALVVLGMLVCAQRNRPLPAVSPLGVGLLLGGLLGAARFAIIDAGVDPTMRLSPAALLALVGLVSAVVAAGMVVLARTSTLPGWMRLRLSAVLACALVSRGLSTGRDAGEVPTTAAVAVAVLGGVLLFSTTAALLRQTITDSSQRLVSLAHRAASAELDVRHGREQLHELNATVAGVAQASRLLIRNGGPRGARRRRLEALLDSEMSRLERMLTRRGQQPVQDVLLDAVLLPLVETQRTLGTDVRFQPSGRHARGRADDIAEATHILLTNAARHAPGAVVTVTVAPRGRDVEVRVSDDGPGVPPALRPTLFAWGARSATSPGQGIGLQLAKRLMLEQAGNLVLEHDGRPGGATFVLTIPASPPGMS